MVAGSVSSAAAAALAGGCDIDVDYEGEYVVDWTQKLGDPNVANPTIHATRRNATRGPLFNAAFPFDIIHADVATRRAEQCNCHRAWHKTLQV